MSYPLMLQPLVIEDNDDVKDAYEAVKFFRSLF